MKLQVNDELKKKNETEEKVKIIQEAEIRRQRNRTASEEKYRKALDKAKLQKVGYDIIKEIVNSKNNN